MMLIEALGWIAILTSPITVFYAVKWLKRGSKNRPTQFVGAWHNAGDPVDMINPVNWPTWLQTFFAAILLFGAALAWFTTGWGGLLVIAVGIVFGIYLRIKNQTDH